ncbi:MAG: ribosome rescue protein RqcH, partial [Candidatus Heimdallarchaeota archaeon]|nr:ribosome rescue protein RqcH [Candidatus Heimdallarchaeota archaeon]
LVIELFGRGNVILVSGQNKILSAITYRKMRDRDIHPGRDFIQMAPQERDIIRDGVDEFKNYIIPNKKIINSLIAWTGLGPFYSKHILSKSRVENKKIEELDADDIIKITSAATDLVEDIIQNKFIPTVYLDKEELPLLNLEDDEENSTDDEVDFDEQWSDNQLEFNPSEVVKILPFFEEDDTLADTVIYHPSSLNIAHDIFYSSQESSEEFEGRSEKLFSKTEKLQNLLNDQTRHLNEFQEEAIKFKSYGDALYYNFTPADELIKTVYQAKKNNLKWDDISNRLQIGKDKRIASALLYDSLIPKEAKIILTLPVESETITVSVDFRKSLVENANLFYEKGKKSERKAKGAIDAIQKTRDKIALMEKESIDHDNIVGEKIIILKRRKAWYEKFHWTRSKEGYLIIGGYDATTNEKLVKRYLDETDVFMHADIQGASSVIIKSQTGIVDDDTLREAGLIAVNYSSAWKGQRGMADAFYVQKDQVSLTPPSGQFLPKGSFMIYGEKSFVSNINLEIYIGFYIEANWIRIVSGSLNSMSKTNFYVHLKPGTKSRGEIAKYVKNQISKNMPEINNLLVKSIDNSELAFIIPGDSEFVDIVINKIS